MSRGLQFLVFFSVMLTLLGGIHYFFVRRIAHDTALEFPWNRIVSVSIIVLGMASVAMLVVGRTFPSSITRLIVFVPYVWLGFSMILFFLLLTGDVVRILYRFALFLRGEHAIYLAQKLAIARTIALGALGITALLVSYGLINGLKEPGVRHVGVHLERFPSALSGFKIAMLSDLHVGPTLGRKWVTKIVAATNRLEPDLIAVVGDLVDGSVENLEQEIAPLRELRAPHGVYFVTGNHEYYSGVDEWIPAIASLGMRVLRNEHVVIKRGEDAFFLAGTDDFSADRFPGHGEDLARALKGIGPNEEVILLAHQPRTIFEAASRDVGLVLAGHTHGGQMWPFVHLVRLQQPYRQGLHRFRSRTQIYVSEGTGYWGPPLRIGTRSEISLIEISR